MSHCIITQELKSLKELHFHIELRYLSFLSGGNML